MPGTKYRKFSPSDPAAALQWALRQYPGILWTTDADSVITSAWGAGLVALGLEPNDKVGLTLAQYFGTEDPQFPVLAAHRRVMQGEVVTVSLRWQGREFESRMQPLRDDAGSVAGCLGVTQDVTARNQAARSMPDLVAQMKSSTERAPDYVVHMDRDGTITFIEGAAPGYQPERVIGTKAEQWLRPETLPLVQGAIRRTLDLHEPQQIEILALGEDQLDRWYDARLWPVIVAGRADGVAAVVYDITERKLVELRLREQVQLLAQVLARIPRAVFWRDRNGVYLGCNEPFARFVGASNPEEVIGRRDADLPRGSELGIWLAQYNRDVLEEGRAVLDVEQELRAEDGREVILLFSRVPLRDAAGAISGVLGTFADVTKTRRTTEELRQARQELQLRVAERTDELAHRNLVEEQRRVQSILDNTTAVVYVKNSEGRYILVNSQFTRIFHLSPEDILGKTDAEIFPADMAARFRANDLQVQAERRAIQFEEVAPHDDGPHHYISVKFPLEDAPDRPCAVCGISTDITERIVSEERLKREEQLLRRLLELREREQMLLAYEIHDGLVHYIVGAKMILEGHGGDRTEGAKLDAGGYQEVLRLLVEAIDDGRRLISELRPPILDEEGIIGAIEYLAAEHLQKSGRTVRFIHDVDFDRLSPLLEQTIFRIVQEALNNFVRHSAASQAQVKLQQSGRTVRLEIQDSGVGFNPAQVSPDRFGLRGIVERSRLFGGNATINSRPGGGTSVVVEIPMDQPVSP